MIKNGTFVEVELDSGKTIRGTIASYDPDWEDYSVVYVNSNGDEDWDWFHSSQITVL